MNRTSIINCLIAKIGATRYLEVGVYRAENFDRICCNYRVGVDPEFTRESQPSTQCLALTSDDFFSRLDASEEYGVIFIDGLHTASQVKKDILNSMKHLSRDGYIVCHDMNPQREEHQAEEYTGGHWNGSGWKAFVELRADPAMSEWSFVTVDTDQGCGIIWRNGELPGNKLALNGLELNWQNLTQNRVAWLNLIHPSQFVSHILGGMQLKPLLNAYLGDPSYDENNFALAMYYDSIDQKASAVSFYIRAAERSKNVELQYECLLRAALCFMVQGTRGLSVRGLLQRALALLPKRPEAYFLLSRWWERETSIEGWVNCYTLSSMGLDIADHSSLPLRTWVEYPGQYGLMFEKAVSGWWVGQCNEARNIFMELHRNHQLDYAHRSAVIGNLKQLGEFRTKEIQPYRKEYHHRLRFKFPGSDKIIHNFSESYQDMFVLSVLNGKRNGTFLEIGSARPFYGNNTALLEKEFDWTGIAIDLDKAFVDEYNAQRSTKCFNLNAVEIDYEKFLKEQNAPAEIDYLQIDIDPAQVSLECLKKIPFDTRKFNVITFEHDGYAQVDDFITRESRVILCSNGYTPLVKHVAPDGWRYYEDWWVRNEFLETAISEMMDHSDSVKSAESYMLNP